MGWAAAILLCIFSWVIPDSPQAKNPETALSYASESCTACHADLSKSKKAAESHPLRMLSYHPIKNYECTDCHMAVTRKEPSLGPKDCPVQQGYFLKGAYVQASCSGCHESTYGLPGAGIAHQGENLFRERGCYSCHTPEQTVKKYAPPLNGISGKLKDKRWLQAWLQGPRSIRPGTMMPDFGISQEKACHIASFLLSLSAHHDYKQPDLSKASAERGAHYFVYRGCRACHKTAPTPSDPVRRIPSLNDAGTKFRPAWVLLELEAPRDYNPDARIPLIDATGEEVLDIMAYLDTLTLDPESLPPLCSDNNRQHIEEGRDFVEMNGCFACHRIDGFERMTPTAGRIIPRLKMGSAPRPWDDLLRIIGLSEQEAGSPSFRRMPRFNLTPKEIESLATYFIRVPVSDTHERFIAQTDKQRVGHDGEKYILDYGCRLCHEIEPGESPYVNTVIERGHLLPPRLVGEGAKIQPKWLVGFLDKPVRMRIWMTMGMPYFYLPQEENHAFVQYFRQKSGFDPTPIDAYRLPFEMSALSSEEQAMGIYRFKHDRCAQCHPVNFDKGLPKNVDPDDLAIDLLMAKDRLRYEWVRDFLRNPDQFAGEGTRMPFIYFTPDGVPKVPDAGQWLERVAKALYLMDTLPKEYEKENTREAIDVGRFWENY